MKKQIQLTIFLFIWACTLGHAQNTFESGYFLDNSGTRITGLIKNADWKNNPVQFEFRSNDSSVVETKQIGAVTEFSIGTSLRFVKASVDIDQSSEITNELNTNPEPVWKTEVVFLQVLIDGKASLYSYRKNGLLRFFYSKEDKVIQQLIHKKYISAENTMASNERFREQLWANVRCPSATLDQIRKLTYEKKPLIQYFKDYATCTSSQFTEYKNTKVRDVFAMSLIGGINSADISINNSFIKNTDIKYGRKNSIRMGLEFEVFLPYNNSSWGITLEPSYFSYFSDIMIGQKPGSVKYRVLEFPVGIKRHIPICKGTEIAIHAQYYNSLYSVLEGKIDFAWPSDTLEMTPSSCISLSVALQYHAFALSFRYFLNQGVLAGYGNWDSETNRLAVTVGYRFLRIRK